MSDDVSIEGLLLPVEWTDDGEVSAVGISASDEQEFRIASEGMAQLLQHLRRRLRVTGKVDRKRSVIEVKSFRVLDRPRGDGNADK